MIHELVRPVLPKKMKNFQPIVIKYLFYNMVLACLLVANINIVYVFC